MNQDPHRSPLIDARVADDAGIPVLTERLVLPALEIDVSLPPAAAPASPPPSPTPEPELAAPEPAAPTPEPAPAIDTEALARRVREQTLARLQSDLAPALEAAVRQRVAAAVDDALLDMLALLQVSLESQLRKAVQAALDEQFETLRAPPPG